MSEHHDRNFAMYDAMETAELEEILRLDSQTPEGEETDTEKLLYIMGVLVDRKKNSVDPGKTAQESWKSFEENYLSDQDIESAPIHQDCACAKKNRRWLHRAIGTAAVIAILIGVPLTAKALNWADIWNAVAAWAKETFSFVTGDQEEYSDPSPKDTNQYQSLQETLNSVFTNPVMVPTWIPDGYELDDIKTQETPNKNTVTAWYKSEGKEFIIQVKSYLSSDSSKMEKAESIIEIYQPSETKYYIYNNSEDTCVGWVQDSFECYIAGELTVDEIKKMIDSIGKG